MTKTLKQRLTLPLTGLLILIVIIISGFFYFNRLLQAPVKIEDIHIDTKSALKLNVLKQISKKNGIKEWELTAASATLLKDEDKALLEDVIISFFTKDNKKIDLTSEQGILNTKSHDMTFSGNVVMQYETFILRTDKLHYTKKKHMIHTSTHVRLEKTDSVIDADSMVTKLNEDKTILTGNVKGTFSEDFNIK